MDLNIEGRTQIEAYWCAAVPLCRPATLTLNRREGIKRRVHPDSNQCYSFIFSRTLSEPQTLKSLTPRTVYTLSPCAYTKSTPRLHVTDFNISGSFRHESFEPQTSILYFSTCEPTGVGLRLKRTLPNEHAVHCTVI